MTNNTPPVRAYGVLALGVGAISLAAIFIRFAHGEGMPSILIAAARLSIAALVLTPVALRRYWGHVRRLSRADFGLAMLAGVFLAAHFAAWVTSLEHTTVLISVVLVTTSPLWVGLLEVVFLKERLTRPIVAGLFVALAGGVIIGLPGADAIMPVDGNPLLGSGLSLFGAMAVAVYLIIGRKLRRDLPLVPYIWLVYGCASLVLVVVVLLTGTRVAGYSGTGYVFLVALALVPQLTGHSSLNYALGYLPATYVSLSTQLEPVGSAIIAFFLFHEVPAAQQMVGSAVIVVGVMLATWGQQVRQRNSGLAG